MRAWLSDHSFFWLRVFGLRQPSAALDCLQEPWRITTIQGVEAPKLAAQGGMAWNPVPAGGLVLGALLCVFAGAAFARESFTNLKADEQVVFYPTFGQRVPGKDTWRVEVRGCVFESEERSLMLAALREALELKDIELTANEEAVFNERTRLFLVDNERGKRIIVRIGEKLFDVGKSSADGSFAGEIGLKETDIRRYQRSLEAGNEYVRFSAELPPGDARRFTGDAMLLEDTGLSVVSDIDDTIKITEVRDRRSMLRNTFLRPFEAAPGMVELYQDLARSNRTTFHYISASPWQLYPPLAEFVCANGFPSGTFALKTFRLKDRSVLSLFADPGQYKTAVIELLLKRFPNRRFLLIGDSGERDPEVYAALAKRYPEQIIGIWIRDVTNEPAGAGRYQEVFRSLPEKSWYVFESPLELNPLPVAPIHTR